MRERTQGPSEPALTPRPRSQRARGGKVRSVGCDVCHAPRNAGQTHVPANPAGCASGCPQPMAMAAREGEAPRMAISRRRLLTQPAGLHAFALPRNGPTGLMPPSSRAVCGKHDSRRPRDTAPTATAPRGHQPPSPGLPISRETPRPRHCSGHQRRLLTPVQSLPGKSPTTSPLAAPSPVT